LLRPKRGHFSRVPMTGWDLPRGSNECELAHADMLSPISDLFYLADITAERDDDSAKREL
jgi:hypothetical protein